MDLARAEQEFFTAPFSLVIPTYNEENRLSRNQGEVIEYLKTHFNKVEVIYVDDGSTDETYSRLLRYEQEYPEVKVLRHEANYGKGKAVRTGLTAANGKLVLFSDVDFSTPIEDVHKLISSLRQGFDIAIGSRGVAGANVEVRQSFLRDSIGKIGNAVVQSLLLLPFEDTQCGFKLYRAEALKIILQKLTVDGFAFDMEMLAVAVTHGFKVAEVPVTWRNVPESKVQAIHNFQVLRDVFRIRYGLAMGKYS